MKKILGLMVMTLLVSSFVFAWGNVAGAAPTGNNYLAMTKESRVQVVTALINGAKEGGVTIKQTPVSYCMKLDAFYAKHPDMKSRDLAIVLKTLIIMEYDWVQKGVDKDQLARQFLGDKLYQQNKARLK
ncbi:MAG: hypothetical protein NTY76_07195 [Candidatus Omnitrophica bacterium]|nr:hypothetical protein [Candidatus Omnitrophota bacterium]